MTTNNFCLWDDLLSSKSSSKRSLLLVGLMHESRPLDIAVSSKARSGLFNVVISSGFAGNIKTSRSAGGFELVQSQFASIYSSRKKSLPGVSVKKMSVGASAPSMVDKSSEPSLAVRSLDLECKIAEITVVRIAV